MESKLKNIPKKKIPKYLQIPVWYTITEEKEFIVDREEMIDALERVIGKLEDKLNK